MEFDSLTEVINKFFLLEAIDEGFKRTLFYELMEHLKSI
jgi:hypothetical protein